MSPFEIMDRDVEYKNISEFINIYKNLKLQNIRDSDALQILEEHGLVEILKEEIKDISLLLNNMQASDLTDEERAFLALNKLKRYGDSDKLVLSWYLHYMYEDSYEDEN